MNTKTCPKCNEVNVITNAVCPKCGRQFKSTAPQNINPEPEFKTQIGFAQPPNFGGQPNPQNQQSYHQPNYNQPSANPTAAPSKGLAIGALICGFLFPIGGIILGIVAFFLASKKPREYGGKGFAVGGIVTGGLLTFLGIISLIFVMILAAQESDQTTRTVSSDKTTSRTTTSNSLAGTLPGGWVNSKGVKNVFFKDGKFAQADPQGNIIGGSYAITDSQTVAVQLSVQGKTGSTTFKISVTDDQHIIIDGLNYTRTGYDK